MKKLISSTLALVSIFTFSSKAIADWKGNLEIPGTTSEGAKIRLFSSYSFNKLTAFDYEIDLQPFEEDADAIRTNTAIVDCNHQNYWVVISQSAYAQTKTFPGGLRVNATSNVSRSLIKAVCSLR